MHRARAILAALATTALAAGAAAPAQADGGIHGVVPARHAAAQALNHSGTSPTATSGLSFQGGTVMHSSTTYAIYWLPSGYQYGATTSDTDQFKALVDQYLTDVATDSGKRTNVYATDAQYTDATGRAAYQSAFGGSAVDTGAFPTSGCSQTGYTVCLTDAQIQAEVEKVMAANGWTASGTHLFILMTPKNVTSCFAASSASTDCAYTGYCAYHSGDSAKGVLYANIAFSDNIQNCASGEYPNGSVGADSDINLISHEHNEAITDPWGDGWWKTSTGDEDGDLCAWQFPTAGIGGTSGAEYDQTIGAGHYYLQPEWSNLDAGCMMDESKWAVPAPSFTVSPATAAPGVSVQFSGAPGGSLALPSYRWAFGDGATAGGITATHSYATPGTRTATLTVTDAFGAVATASQQVVTLGDQLPIADIALPSAPVAGTPATFGPGASNDPDGTIVSYAWTFGDGGTSTAASPQHAYAAAGTYTVTLTVTDDAGGSATATRSLVVAPAPALAGTNATATQTPSPTATATAPASSPAGATPVASAATTASLTAPRLTLSRIAGVRLRRGRGTLVLRVRSSAAGRVTVTFRGVRRTFRLRAGANTLRIAIRSGHAGRPRVTLQAAAADGTRGVALRRRVTLRLR